MDFETINRENKGNWRNSDLCLHGDSASLFELDVERLFFETRSALVY